MILIIDSNELLMKAIFIWRKSKTIPFEYFYLLQLFKYLKMFQYQTVYLAADKDDSWRKAIFTSYKENRKKLRDSFPDIPWEKIFNNYDKLLQNINLLTSINSIQIPHLEGDDIISALCHIYKDQNKVVISQDRDLSQLIKIPNTKVYSTRSNKFRTLEEAEKTIAKKISSGDSSDDIPKANSLTEKIRNCLLIDLVNLPQVIIDEVYNYIKNIRKEIDVSKFLSIYKYRFLEKYKEILK